MKKDYKFNHRLARDMNSEVRSQFRDSSRAFANGVQVSSSS